MFNQIVKVIILFCLSMILAYLLILNQHKLLKFWNHVTGQVTLQSDNTLDQKDSTQHNVKLSNTLPIDSVIDGEHSSDQDDFQCTTTPVEKVSVKKAKKIYRWKDNTGKVHFGDSAFHSAEAESVQLKHRKELDYFSLKITGDEQPTRFSDQLSTRINKVFLLLSDMIPRDNLQKVTVDLKLFNNAKDYQEYSRLFNRFLGKTTDGYYMMSLNQAVVFKRNERQAGLVALHESTHVINAGIFGFLPRWMNEGIAEYIETMTVTGQAVQIHPNRNWTRNGVIRKNKLVSFNELLSASYSDWDSSKKASYYATSWALIYFLMDSEEDQQWLGELLSEKAQKRCQRSISLELIDNRYPGGVYHLQQRFNQWLVKTPSLSTHRF
ncbi:MAG: DUF1570 domain-containing protein [Gammaproteobacteria bacterium]|nr:DUF1570 domain-containing protein [Gammaproteobacteria bacterium]